MMQREIRADEMVAAAARVARIAENARVGVVTGAGVSVASGVPDFRGNTGLWVRFDPMEYATISAFREDPAKVWRMFRAVDDVLRGVAPNAAHDAIAALERLGLSPGVVTQNIDGLHERAGSQRVVSVHGHTGELHCIYCGASYARGSVAPEADGVPYCGCGRALKPAVTLFGEELPAMAMTTARRMTEDVDVLLVVGTSGMVAPANTLPDMVQARGGRVVEVNLSPHPVAATGKEDVFLRARAEHFMPALVQALSGESA